jgi:hypothetical protein
MARCHLILACLALSAFAAVQGRVMLEGELPIHSPGALGPDA